MTRQINGDKPVVIDFWATWCGPCRVISPVFAKLSDDPAFAGVEFYKVDVDQQDQIAQEVGVRAVRHIHVIVFVPSLDFIQMPTFALFKKGEKVSDLVGARPQDLQVCQFMIFNPLCAELSLCSDPRSKGTYHVNNRNLCGRINI